MSIVCETLQVARSNITARVADRPKKRRERPPLPDAELVSEIQDIITELPTYGYRRVHAVLRRKAILENRSWPNVKRVYRVMKEHSLLLQRYTGDHQSRKHDGKVSVGQSNLRWCSDGFEISCDNKEKVRVAFALDCCDRETLGHVATTQGIKSQDVQDLAILAVEYRFGSVNILPHKIEWLTDNGSCFIAKDTKSLLRQSVWRPEQRLSEARNQMVWLRHLSKPSSATMSALIPPRKQKPLSNHCIYGSSITMSFTHIKL